MGDQLMIYSRIGRLLASLVVCFCLAGAANASVIVVERQGNDNGSFLPFSNGETDFLYAVSWTQNFSFHNGVITALNLNNEDTADATVFFDLCYGQPDCATPIFGDVVVPANTALYNGQVNFGLPLSLGSGSWFLLAYAQGSPLAGWRTGGPGEAAAPGAALGLEYFTDSDGGLFTFGEGEPNLVNAGYRVEGDLENVPEPSSWFLAGSGLILAGVVLRRRRS
jgi:hypothetical protein